MALAAAAGFGLGLALGTAEEHPVYGDTVDRVQTANPGGMVPTLAEGAPIPQLDVSAPPVEVVETFDGEQTSEEVEAPAEPPPIKEIKPEPDRTPVKPTPTTGGEVTVGGSE